MKSNKELVFDFMQTYANRSNKGDVTGCSTQYLSEQLEMQRSNISAILNQLVKENRVEKMQGRPVLYRIANLSPSMKEVSCFKKLIGYDGSLKNAVQLAKAAILYPQHSLHTLILGPSGSGKSYFASLMYEFAIEHRIIKEDAPFIKFNCRYYDGCEDQMMERLFGSEEDGSGSIITQAKHGILFIDHIDLLPVRSRNILFDLMEQDIPEIHNVIIICAVNDSVNKTLLTAFKAKFSVSIDMLPLQARKMEERLALVQEFFTAEATKMKRVIKVNSELLRCVLLYRCEGNVKQLKMDIKIGCANAYVREFNIEIDELHIYMNDFPSYVRKGFLFYKDCRDEIEQLIPQNYAYTFSSEQMEKIEDVLTKYNESGETLYDIIERKAGELRDRGIVEEDINTIISVDVESDLNHVQKRISDENINKESLAKIVDTRIITFVEQFLHEASKRFGRVYPVATFYGLCLHLSATLERCNKAQRLANTKIMEVVETYKEEYAFCMTFSMLIEKEFDIRLPIDEIVFITMFICDNSTKKTHEKKPVVLIAMHGNATASSIVEVVRTLVKSHNTFAYDLSLEKDMQLAYDEIKERIQEIDEGKGVLMLYDMGSLKTMGEMVMQETGIKIRMIEMPATLLALDCSRKAMSDTSLDQIFDDVMESYQQSYAFVKESYQRLVHKQVIITLCMSGKGGAISMKQYLEKNMDCTNIDVLPYAVSDREYLLNEVNMLMKDNEVLCVVGTYDPKLYGIPFISITKLFETSADKLPMLLALEDIGNVVSVDYEAIYAYLKEQLPTLDIKQLKKFLPRVIAKIKKVAQGLSQDQELGLFMHIACSINRIQVKDKMPVNIHRESILNRNKRLYNDVREILIPLEEAFEVAFSDDELANILSIIKQI